MPTFATIWLRSTCGFPISVHDGASALGHLMNWPNGRQVYYEQKFGPFNVKGK